MQGVELKKWDQVGAAVEDIIKAVTKLDDAGFHGPYVLGLCASLYNLLFRRYPQGNLTEIEHVRQIAADGVVKAPAIETGGVLVASGTQFASIVLGQDMMAGFVGPVARDYEFSVSETVALRLVEPGVVCVLKA